MKWDFISAYTMLIKAYAHIYIMCIDKSFSVVWPSRQHPDFYQEMSILEKECVSLRRSAVGQETVMLDALDLVVKASGMSFVKLTKSKLIKQIGLDNPIINAISAGMADSGAQKTARKNPGKISSPRDSYDAVAYQAWIFLLVANYSLAVSGDRLEILRDVKNDFINNLNHPFMAYSRSKMVVFTDLIDLMWEICTLVEELLYTWGKHGDTFDRLDALEELLEVYIDLLAQLAAIGAQSSFYSWKP